MNLNAYFNHIVSSRINYFLGFDFHLIPNCLVRGYRPLVMNKFTLVLIGSFITFH